jgi:glycosyltransferase involved in cell wall biosynthesis
MKRILLISPIPTHPQLAGNRTRIQRLLTSLREMGHEVHFLCVNTEPWKADEEAMARWWGEHFYLVKYRHPARSLRRYAERLRFIREPGFLEILPVDYRYDEALNSVLDGLRRRITFDVVIVEYIFWSKALERFDGRVVKVIDTHDVFTRRHLLFRKAQQPYGWYCTTATEEAKALNRADVVIAIQDHEKAFFSTLTRKPVVTVRHIAPLAPVEESHASGATLLFIGSDAGTNIHGMRMFIADTLPLIRNLVPEARLEIVGPVCEKIEDAEGCFKRGIVDDVEPAYARADVVINPIHLSTGLYIKTIEALGYGKAVVATSAGSRGMEEAANKAFFLADTPEEFARKVALLLRDPAERTRLREHALQYVRRWNEESLRELAAVLEHPVAQRLPLGEPMSDHDSDTSR